MTNYYKSSSLKQHKFIPPQFWRSEAQNQSHGAAVRVLPVLASSGAARGESVSFTFSASPGRSRCLLCGPLPTSLQRLTSMVVSPAHPPASLHFVIFIGSTWIIKIPSPLKILNMIPSKAPFALPGRGGGLCSAYCSVIKYKTANQTITKHILMS